MQLGHDSLGTVSLLHEESFPAYGRGDSHNSWGQIPRRGSSGVVKYLMHRNTLRDDETHDG